MVRTGASSQSAGTLVNRGSGTSATAAPAGRVPTGPTGTLGRRKASGRSAASRAAGGSGMNFYTDDTPGLKISPAIVIVMSLGFIGFVTILHIIGKIKGN
mmetsp:Transcript_6366/g.18307  ORF Transcript_6366/g.18307 Transcript_6366/m.18307 type:complete len:100 (-) Transcript_6366:379-678(-)|eukprot:CAMPEP_0206134774 /NCGR_PEP_ID=MMETSP1473-20131121/199_1 /ASSEMBLY_ACC=CAM_ASM_001109 /TAXON_ID=1461547 /ORGANISM="Stichococcus sp, Strain RCC1054" /LENGTH=99 /DNA_ID=CAMNT_0053526395 /DNA_START=176 /DNA_END=475 /DNA_ORIENTATION=-